MIQIRRSKARGHANHGWLDSHHTFSFGNYYDPNFTGFHDLLVINEDRVTPGNGFGTHGHKDMEIISYVLEGALEHQDSMGTGSVLRPGQVQRMSAGKGVRHSEFNHSETDPLHFLQIWITPQTKGIQPSYEEKDFSNEEKKNKLKLIVSPDGTSDSIKIHQNASIYASILDEGQSVTHTLSSGRKSWAQVISGTIELNGETLHTGDGAAIENIQNLKLTAKKLSEVLVFDLP
jgi:redox-sensitive bicupin YhaK (pirin superfamily)